VRFATGVTLRIDGYTVRIAEGETKTVMSASGEYEVVPVP
jgi:hypothetical protein